MGCSRCLLFELTEIEREENQCGRGEQKRDRGRYFSNQSPQPSASRQITGPAKPPSRAFAYSRIFQPVSVTSFSCAKRLSSKTSDPQHHFGRLSRCQSQASGPQNPPDACTDANFKRPLTMVANAQSRNEKKIPPFKNGWSC